MPLEDQYDYIIVSGGTAGCPLAAILSEYYHVLVECSGVPHDNPNLMTQEGFFNALNDLTPTPRRPAQPFTSEDGVPQRQRPGYSGAAAAQSMPASTTALTKNSTRGQRGQLCFQPKPKNWQLAIRDGLLEVGVDPYNGFSLDHSLGSKIGASTFDSSGNRHSAADLLSYAKSSNIKVVVHASVERVILGSSSRYVRSKHSGVGVVYRDETGRFHHAMVREKGEVILCAGAIGSPQLLLLSGIGPRPYLSSWGIPVVHHLPYVGQFLYDNPRNGISFVPPIPLEHSLIQVVGITDPGACLEATVNIVSFSSPARSVFLRTRLLRSILLLRPLWRRSLGLSLQVHSVWHRLTLGSTQFVQFNYFSNPGDLEKWVNGTWKIGDVLRSCSMEEFKYQEWLGGRDFRHVGPALPVDQSNDLLMGDFCRRGRCVLSGTTMVAACSPNPKSNSHQRSHHLQPPAQPWTATCAATRQPPASCAALAQPDSHQPSLLRSLCAAPAQPDSHSHQPSLLCSPPAQPPDSHQPPAQPYAIREPPTQPLPVQSSPSPVQPSPLHSPVQPRTAQSSPYP
ncbi:glucose-methanol-choline (GMC) oxidoreductase family protein [Actinidia rufa]|uniref:Glucose-methanol-choline (GMC) oxidoreductase family protein n=1 Tax=Actinidia rufa TaxID=165716 RepID=A0A7J0FFP4_9ERIC|nr:glucose-methanol-choline (GMC) oxidoreductase family protein [Actinidia rufa]